VTGRVLVLGNASLDLFIAVPRLPRPGETLVGGPFRRSPGGKGLNQAVMAARTGTEVLFCAPLGRDAEGDAIDEVLRREPIAQLVFHQLDVPTDMSVIAVADGGENCILTAGACADALPPGQAARFAAQAGPEDILLLQGNLNQEATCCAAGIARANGARVVLNAAPIRWKMDDVLASCWGIVANEIEAELLTGAAGCAAAAALAGSGVSMVAVTLGARGCLLNGTMYPAVPVVTVDTTGAGDAFCGTLAAALARGSALPDAVSLAQHAAAETVTRRGAFEALPSAFTLRA
jgi:ribokinase